MNYSLGNTLSRGMALASLDADAKAYIAAVTATGTSVSGTQKAVINNFYETAKLDGYYTSLKRLYLPIWASASANAIDLIGLTSGTFVGGVTHSAGFVQSNGTTGYFNMNTTYPANSLTLSDASMFFIARTVSLINFKAPMGAGVANPADFYNQTLGTQIVTRWCSNTNALTSNSSPLGIISFSRKSGTRNIWKRITSGRSNIGTATNADAGASVPVSSVFALSNNNTDSVPPTATPSSFHAGEFGGYGFGLGLTDVQDTAFTLGLKNLWEGATGLTLP